MDSKYTAYGKEKDQRNKFDIKAKRIKLAVDGNNCKYVKENNQANGSLKNNNVCALNVLSEDVQEARKSLPVYIVRNR